MEVPGGKIICFTFFIEDAIVYDDKVQGRILFQNIFNKYLKQKLDFILVKG